MIEISCAGAPPATRFALVRGSSSDRRALRPLAREALLAQLDVIAPRDGALVETPRGPVGVGAWAGIGMSVAYADDAALVAVARWFAIGVDLVAIALPPEWPELCRTYLSARDADEIACADPAARAALFTRAWARREAHAKCLGEALTEHAPTPMRGLLLVEPTTPGFAAAAALRPAAASAARATG